MFFGKKEDKAKLPDLPSLNPISFGSGMIQPPAGAEEDLPLPAFPDSPSEDKLPPLPNNSMPERNEMMRMPMQRTESVESTKLVEMDEWEPESEPSMSEAPENFPVGNNHPELEEVEEREEIRRVAPLPRRTAPRETREAPAADVFVRIDKFHTGRKALGEISERLESIDELVKRVRETKLREEQELASWEKDITHIKSRLQAVTEDIFEKVD